MSLSVKQCGMESIRSIVTASGGASECSEKFNCCCVRAIEMRASIAVAGAVEAACSSTDYPRRGNGKSTADRFGKA